MILSSKKTSETSEASPEGFYTIFFENSYFQLAMEVEKKGELGETGKEKFVL